MKKILTILIASLLWCSVVFAEEINFICKFDNGTYISHGLKGKIYNTKITENQDETIILDPERERIISAPGYDHWYEITLDAGARSFSWWNETHVSWKTIGYKSTKQKEWDYERRGEFNRISGQLIINGQFKINNEILNRSKKEKRLINSKEKVYNCEKSKRLF